MALVRDTRTWAGDQADIKTYLDLTGIDTYDFQLELWYTQAAEEADVYLDFRPWVDDDDVDVVQPTSIFVGCLDWVRAVYQAYKNKAAAGGVTSIKTAQLARTFAAAAGGGLNIIDIGKKAAASSWYPYKLDVLTGGMQ